MLIYKICATLILIAGCIFGYRGGEKHCKGDGALGVIAGIFCSGIIDLILCAIWIGV